MTRKGMLVSLIFLLVISSWNSTMQELLSEPPLVQGTLSEDVTGFEEYTVVYQLDIPDEAQYNNGPIPYSIDSSSSIDFSFDRVAYYLELEEANQPRTWVFVSFPSITTKADELGIPTFSSGIVHNQ